MLTALITSQLITFAALIAERHFVAASMRKAEIFRQIRGAVQIAKSSNTEEELTVEQRLLSGDFRFSVYPYPRIGLDQVDRRQTALLSQALSNLPIRDVRVVRQGAKLPRTRIIVEGQPPVFTDADPLARSTRQHLPSNHALTERFEASVELDDGRWLDISATTAEPPPFVPVLAIGAILSAIFLILAAIWAANRVTRPLERLTATAGKLGRSSEVQLAAEDGPEDIRLLAREFNAMATRILHVFDEQQHLLRAVGHDLRTPLALLKLRLEYIDDEALKQKMADTIEQMEQLTSAALEAARGGAVNEPARVINIHALVEAMCEDAAEAGLPVSFLGADEVDAMGRSSELRRAFQNLIDNAIRYGGSASVKVRAVAGTAVVIVSDEGPGIPNAELDEVLKPFVRIEGSRSPDTGGTGLGLAIANSIAGRHFGSLQLSNGSAKGLVATFSLPAIS
jgi:signal transduction histidine kinase